MTTTEERMDSYTMLAERRIRQQFARGDHFVDVERYIERLPLDPDLKSALWLIAWAELPLHERRGIILDAAAARREDARALEAQAQQACRQSSALMAQAKATRATNAAARIARKLLS